MKKNYRPPIGRIIQARREKMGKSIEQFAGLIGEKASVVKKLEKRTRRISDLKMAERISDTLGISRSSLLSKNAQHFA